MGRDLKHFKSTGCEPSTLSSAERVYDPTGTMDSVSMQCIYVFSKGKRVCFRPLRTRQQKPLETQRRLFETEVGALSLHVLIEDMAV